jgi:hypothetical protein
MQRADLSILIGVSGRFWVISHGFVLIGDIIAAHGLNDCVSSARVPHASVILSVEKEVCLAAGYHHGLNR